MIVTAFTISHSVTLATAVQNIITPPAAVMEPLIALNIVAVGTQFRFQGVELSCRHPANHVRVRLDAWRRRNDDSIDEPFFPPM